MVLQGCPSLASQVAGLAAPWRSTFPPLQDLISLWQPIHSLTKIGRTEKNFCSSEMDLHAGENGFAGRLQQGWQVCSRRGWQGARKDPLIVMLDGEAGLRWEKQGQTQGGK